MARVARSGSPARCSTMFAMPKRHASVFKTTSERSARSARPQSAPSSNARSTTRSTPNEMKSTQHWPKPSPAASISGQSKHGNAAQETDSINAAVRLLFPLGLVRLLTAFCLVCFPIVCSGAWSALASRFKRSLLKARKWPSSWSCRWRRSG